MYRCNNCGQEIDEHQFKNFNQLCPSCLRLIQSKTAPSQSDVLIANELRITNLEKRKSDLSAYLVILVAIPSVFFAFSIMAIIDGRWMELGYLGAILLPLIQCSLIILIIKKWKGINAEIRALS